MAADQPSRAELIAELTRLNHYGRELARGKNDAELFRELARLHSDRQAIRGIFNYKIFGPAAASGGSPKRG